MSNWSFQPVFGSYVLVVLMTLGLVALVLVPTTFHALRPGRRRTLVMIRLALVALVLLALLRPTHTRTTNRPQTAVLLVLFDQSRSMELPAVSGGASRWQAQAEILHRIERQLEELARLLEVRVYGYDHELHAIQLDGGVLPLPEKPAGRFTDIGSSLYRALENELGKRIAGIVLLGDGNQTAPAPAVELHDAARELAVSGYPLYTVVFGPSADTGQSRDVALETLPEHYTVFVKNELLVRGMMRVRGYINKEIAVSLTVEDSAGVQQTIGPVNLQASEDGELVDIRLTHTPTLPGQYKLTLAAETQPGELVVKNNSLSAFLTVLDGGLRVLYLEGEPRQEQKFLRWSLDASPDIDLDFQWAQRRLRRDWPLNLQGMIDASQYDAYILGDLDSTALGEENLAALAAAVEKGAGLIMMGGYHSFDPGGYRNTPLRDVLPIEMDRLARQDFDLPEQERWHVVGDLAMIPARDHPVMRLVAGDTNEQAWRRLPALNGANRFVGLKSAAGVQLVAESPDGVPLLVAGEYGRGRVLAFAADSTWQWWRRGFESEHKRFWRQVILWLVRRDDLEKDEVWVDLPQRRIPLGARITFQTGARRATGEPLTDVDLAATLVGPSGATRPIRLARDGDAYAGLLVDVAEAGSYSIQATATRGGQPVGQTVADFQVLDRDVEMSSPAADPDQMARLANATRDAGGRVVAPEQLPDLLAEIQKNPPRLEEEVVLRWQLADTWWDAWLVLACVAALLSWEWFLRKKWGLV